MTHILSDWARAFLREDRVAVVSTLNTDGSPQVTTIWYLLQEDGTLIMSTQILPHEIYLSFQIDMIYEALSNFIFLPQETLRVFRPGPFLFVAEFDNLFTHRTNIPVLEDTPVPGGGIRYGDRLLLIR